jgi:hypothetical protein
MGRKRKPKPLAEIDKDIRRLMADIDREKTAEFLLRHNVNPQYLWNVLDQTHIPVEVMPDEPKPVFEDRAERDAEIRRLRNERCWSIPMIMDWLEVSESTVMRALNDEYAEYNRNQTRDRKRRKADAKRRGDVQSDCG